MALIRSRIFVEPFLDLSFLEEPAAHIFPAIVGAVCAVML